MAAIDDLIARVGDKALRDRLRSELDRLTKDKKFGLVFEEHIPELTPVYPAKVRRGCLVALRTGTLTDTWRVLSVSDGRAHCVNRASGQRREMAVGDLVVVREFGDPIFPSLAPMDRVENGGKEAPWHTLIEADNYHALQLLEYCYAGQVDCIYIDPPYNTGARDWKYNNDYVDANDRWRHSKWLTFLKRRLAIVRRLLNPSTGIGANLRPKRLNRL
jgi:adenine-specific DNA-methyltransferase